MKNFPIDITQYLPHRKPMLMTDNIIYISDNKVVTDFFISPNCIFVDNNQLAEVGIIEHIAQTCSSIVAQEYFVNPEIKRNLLGFIAGIKSIKIMQLPFINTKIESHAVLQNRLNQQDYVLCTITCNTFFDNINIAQAEISLILKEDYENKSGASRQG